MLALVNAAFDEALDVLGQPSKKALLYYLNQLYGISLDSPNVNLEQLHLALESVIGATGALIIMESIFIEMDRLACSK